MQDSYNLAWKLAYVLRGEAGLGLLDSYTLERQPIGAGIIKRANDGFRDNQKAWKGLGLGDQSPEGLQNTLEALVELKAATPAGVKRRALWREFVTPVLQRCSVKGITYVTIQGTPGLQAGIQRYWHRNESIVRVQGDCNRRAWTSSSATGRSSTGAHYLNVSRKSTPSRTCRRSPETAQALTVQLTGMAIDSGAFASDINARPCRQREVLALCGHRRGCMDCSSQKGVRASRLTYTHLQNWSRPRTHRHVSGLAAIVRDRGRWLFADKARQSRGLAIEERYQRAGIQITFCIRRDSITV